jgi:hypothetical protein
MTRTDGSLTPPMLTKGAAIAAIISACAAILGLLIAVRQFAGTTNSSTKPPGRTGGTGPTAAANVAITVLTPVILPTSTNASPTPSTTTVQRPPQHDTDDGLQGATAPATTSPATVPVEDYSWDANGGGSHVVFNPKGRVEQPFVAVHPFLDKFVFVAAFDRRPGFCPACTVLVRILRAPNTNDDACPPQKNVAVQDNRKTTVSFLGCQLSVGTRYYAQIYFPGDTATMTVYTNSASPPGGSANYLIAYGASGAVPAASAVRGEIWGSS